jgi:hypothetical protein
MMGNSNGVMSTPSNSSEEEGYDAVIEGDDYNDDGDGRDDSGCVACVIVGGGVVMLFALAAGGIAALKLTGG